MQEYIAILISIFILVCAFIVLDYREKNLNLKSNKSVKSKSVLPVFSLSYDVDAKAVKRLLTTYKNGNLSEVDNEGLCFFLLTILARHRRSKLYRKWFLRLYCDYQSRYGLNVDVGCLSRVDVHYCVMNNKPDIYCFLKGTDCFNRAEYNFLLSYVNYYLRVNRIPDGLTLKDFISLVYFLSQSRFSGNLGYCTDGFNLIYLKQVFYVLTSTSHSFFKTGVTLCDAYTSGDLSRIRTSFGKDLLLFYKANSLKCGLESGKYASRATLMKACKKTISEGHKLHKDVDTNLFL